MRLREDPISSPLAAYEVSVTPVTFLITSITVVAPDLSISSFVITFVVAGVSKSFVSILCAVTTMGFSSNACNATSSASFFASSAKTLVPPKRAGTIVPQIKAAINIPFRLCFIFLHSLNKIKIYCMRFLQPVFHGPAVLCSANYKFISYLLNSDAFCPPSSGAAPSVTNCWQISYMASAKDFSGTGTKPVLFFFVSIIRFLLVNTRISVTV